LCGPQTWREYQIQHSIRICPSQLSILRQA
jgi:hypothetical protein